MSDSNPTRARAGTDAPPGPSGPVAIVAGASRGLGLLIAAELIRRGYVVAIAARNADALDRAAERLGAAAHPYVCDVGDRAQVAGLVRAVEAELGPVEVSIHVAGIIQVGPAADATVDHFDEAIDTMLKGPIHLAWAVLPGMRHRHRGRIGTVASVGGMVSPPHLLPYATAKFGAVGFSDGLAAELAGSGVTATTIVPGLMRTGSHTQALFFGDSAHEYAWFAPAASLPLLSMDAERAARTIVAGVLAGKPFVSTTPLTWLAIRVRGLAPATTTRLMKLVAGLLPSATGNPTTVPGSQARDDLDSALVNTLTTLGDQAAEANLER